MNRLLSLPLLSCFTLVALIGCAGYQLGDVKPSAYEGINNLHVPIFRNKTLEPRLSSLVTNAVLKEYPSRGIGAMFGYVSHSKLAGELRLHEVWRRDVWAGST